MMLHYQMNLLFVLLFYLINVHIHKFLREIHEVNVLKTISSKKKHKEFIFKIHIEKKSFTSFLLVKSSIEFCVSVRIRLILASIVSLEDIARFICASKTDRSTDDNDDELDKSTFEYEPEEFINKSLGKNPIKKKTKLLLNY